MKPVLFYCALVAAIILVALLLDWRNRAGAMFTSVLIVLTVIFLGYMLTKNS